MLVVVIPQECDRSFSTILLWIQVEKAGAIMINGELAGREKNAEKENPSTF